MEVWVKMAKIFNGWLTRFRRRHHQDAFLDTLDEVEQFKRLVEAKQCLACGNHTLRLEQFQRSPSGWEAAVSCKNCYSRGLVNSEGFTFEKLHSKGRAVKE